MAKPTRTTIAVAITFVAVAAFGACVAALAGSMYNEVVALPHEVMVLVSIFTIGFAALGLVHIVWTRGDPSHLLCLFLVFADLVCCSVLLGDAVNAIPLTMRAVEKAPVLTTYQHRMEAFFASDASRQYNYSDSLLGRGYASDVPSNPMRYTYSDEPPFLQRLPTRTNHRVPGMWPDPNVTAEIARTLATLPTIFFNVMVTATTTIDSFCVNLTETRSNVSTLDPVAVQRAAAIKSELYNLCRGCAVLSNVTTKYDALQSWIHATCPMDVPKPTGAYCVATADCTAYKIKNQEDLPVLIARDYELAVAIAAGTLVFFLLLLFARLWVLHRAQKRREAMREAVVQTPVNNA
ncbi:hypothetical protein SPRG_02639 [Saprolegnia parasitica CBS 223.65]|uniref:Uncharacterized protein n=1 Tax=Saprolegnia parasitica (strain CBS 223.65) TaxID=695850 RepID=A0A067D2F4_SAPPC|nr:hypothetical protein SPRG_02639 [Saprolegnia parasitica CBS 223.65]KDO32946.1 hypothetical protein SPRG_02639 [Saprolegnia parasitica CBS 223.65]|eukprot:XP_012196593.1 hypothetical protein SPRG_02639 [Saprolegnia parasitica CBS 223.65]